MCNFKVINEKNLINNINVFKSKKKLCLVVKANAYGHGIKEIVSIAKGRVDYFAVANIEEALMVRSIDNHTAILILGNVTQIKKCKTYNFEFLISSLSQLKLALKNGCENLLHLKIDCGMNRFGVKDEQEIIAINDFLNKNNIVLKGVCTHFPNLKNKRKTYENYENFQKKLKLLSENQKKFIHFGGSAIFDYDVEYDMLRAGFGVYGYYKKCTPVMTIKSRIIEIKHLFFGDEIGYDGKFRADRTCSIGIIPVGYADGLPRDVSSKWKVKILGNYFDIVGNVCMDCAFIKIPPNAHLMTEVEIMSNAESKPMFAYETLTRFSNFRGSTIIKK